MRSIGTLILAAAALVSALPEPAPRPLCSKLALRCNDPATRYCSKKLTTTTTLTDDGSPAATVTAFLSDYPCLNVQNAKAKRQTEKVPKCLRKIVQSGGDAALTSACACYSIYPSTATEGGGTPTETVYASRFIMNADRDQSKYAQTGVG